MENSSYSDVIGNAAAPNISQYAAECGSNVFIKGLSSLDLLFNCGPKAGEILRAAKLKRDELVAA